MGAGDDSRTGSPAARYALPGKWRNWSLNQQCAPLAVVQVTAAEEIAALVEVAEREGRTVRVSGGGYSCNESVCTDDYLLSLDRFSDLVEADPASRLVRVQAGITVRTLNEMLNRLGLALPSIGAIDGQTLAGAIATGTHGSGRTLASISDCVEAVQMVTGRGELVEVDRSDADALRAARVNLGALGVMTEITLRCVPRYAVCQTQRVMALPDVLDGVADYVRDNDQFEFWAFPWSDVALVTTRNPEDKTAEPAAWRRARERVQRTLLESWGVEACCRLAARAPKLTPALSRRMAGTLRDSMRTDRSDRITVVPRPLKIVGTEWAVAQSSAADAIRGTLRLLAREHFASPIPIGCRFAPAADAFLSNATAHPVCFVDLVAHRAAGCSFAEIESAMEAWAARPHWGKHFSADREALRARYPEWDRFQSVRARLDPNGRFVNDYCRRVLGPVDAPNPSSIEFVDA